MASGSAPGEKRGGRKKGTRNKRTLDIETQLAVSGELPRDYMLRIMRDANAEPARRDAMAKAAAPYIHPQLSAVQMKVERSVEQIPDAELEHIAAGSGERAAPPKTH